MQQQTSGESWATWYSLSCSSWKIRKGGRKWNKLMGSLWTNTYSNTHTYTTKPLTSEARLQQHHFRGSPYSDHDHLLNKPLCTDRTWVWDKKRAARCSKLKTAALFSSCWLSVRARDWFAAGGSEGRIKRKKFQISQLRENQGVSLLIIN